MSWPNENCGQCASALSLSHANLPRGFPFFISAAWSCFCSSSSMSVMMFNFSVAQLESLKQPLPSAAPTIRVERKLEGKKEQWQRKTEKSKRHQTEFWQLGALHWHKTDDFITNFILSGIDMPALSVQESSLNAKIIQQALPASVFLSYLLVKVQTL